MGLCSWAMMTTLCGETSRQHPGWPEGRQSSNRTCCVPVFPGMERSHALLCCSSGRVRVALYPWYRRPWNSMDAIEGECSATTATYAGRIRVALYPWYRRRWNTLDSRCRPMLCDVVPSQDERNSSCRRARCAFATSASAGVAGRGLGSGVLLACAAGAFCPAQMRNSPRRAFWMMPNR